MNNYPNQGMPRPKVRPPFKGNCNPMQPGGRRYITPSIPQTQYPTTVGYQCTPQYSAEYAAVQYSPQLSAQPAWNQTIPITMAESYQHTQTYPPQQYASEPPHMMAVPNSAFIPHSQVQNQNEFDPFVNISTCPKCHTVNTRMHMHLKALTEEKERLTEQLNEMERQLGKNVSPAPHVSSLSVDAQEFQMGASQEPKPRQGTHSYGAPVPTQAAEAPTRQHSNGSEYPGNNWSSYPDTTPVVSASDIKPARGKVELSVEPPSVSANCGEVVTPSGHFSVSSIKQEEPELACCAPQQDDMRSRPRDETQKNRQKDRQRTNNNRPRGSYDGNRDGEGNRRSSNSSRRESGGSNSGQQQHRSSSPQDRQEEKSVPRSRDSSQGCPKSGPDHPDKKESESGAKIPDSRDRSLSERRGVESGDRGNRRGTGRRFNEAGGGRGKSSEDSNWRNREQDSGKRDDSRDNFPRTGNRGGSGSGSRRPMAATTFKAVVEKDGDLFNSPVDYSLAHCVAEDLRMGSGIAVNFRQKFKQVEELMDQKKRAGQVAHLEEGSRFVFYLVTKRWSTDKPTWGDFCQSVRELGKLCEAKGVKNLAMPRIGCGLDRLEWRSVKQLLEEVFLDTGVTVTVYNFQQNEEPESPSVKAKSTLYFVNQRKDLVDIDALTGLIFLCSEESTTTNRTIESLDKKHKIAVELRSTKRAVGEVVTLKRGQEYLYGLVVRKTEKDPLSYACLGKCFRKLRSTNNKEKYGYFGLEAFRDGQDTLTMAKVVTVLRNIFGGVQYKLEFYVCWPKELEGDHVWEEPSPK